MADDKELSHAEIYDADEYEEPCCEVSEELEIAQQDYIELSLMAHIIDQQKHALRALVEVSLNTGKPITWDQIGEDLLPLFGPLKTPGEIMDDLLGPGN